MHTISINHTQWNDFSLKDIDNYITSHTASIEFVYKSDFKNAKILRDCVEYILQSFNLAQKDIARYVLACDEMNNNAIEHGSKPGDTNTLRIQINKTETQISLDIQVQDSGNGSTAKSAQQMNECKNKRLQIDFTKHNSIRGRGLFLIIVNIVDELYFKDADKWGLIVGFKKDLPYWG